MKRLFVIGLLVFVFVGCRTQLGSDGRRMRASGDVVTDGIYLEGQGIIWYGELKVDGDGNLVPDGEGWAVQCLSDKCKAEWNGIDQTNAQRDVEMVKAIGEIALEGLKEGAIRGATGGALGAR